MTPALFLIAACLFLYSCSDPGNAPVSTPQTTAPAKKYTDLKKEIAEHKKKYWQQYASTPDKSRLLAQIKNYWVSTLGNDLYEQWKGTPWDFNGTTTVPHQGSIACGYFVTTLLQDMGYPLDRVKLATCASLTMMKQLAPELPASNLSSLSYAGFNQRIKSWGKGVFIIGLDFHTGFLINDGTETWFLHSNYINRQGVIKEKISESAALQASRSRFVICLTSSEVFLQRWMKN